MAWPDAVSIAGELGVRKSGESRPLAYLAQQIMRRHILPVARTLGLGNDRLAHLSPYLFHTSSIYRRRAEDHAGVAAPLNDSRDAGYVHAGGYKPRSVTRKKPSSRFCSTK